MFQKIQKAVGRIQDVFLALIGIALALIMVIVFVQTFTRFVIFYSLPWSEELSRYLFVFIIMIGLNVAIRDDMLIRIDLIDYFIKGKAAVVLNLLRTIVGLGVSAIVGVNASSLFKIGMIQKSPAMQIPMIIMYSVIFAGYLLAAVAMIIKLIEAIQQFSAPKNGEGGAEV